MCAARNGFGDGIANANPIKIHQGKDGRSGRCGDRILRLALSRKAKLCADLKHCGACLLIKYKLHSFIISSRGRWRILVFFLMFFIVAAIAGN